ncbi:hypothetical protein [Oceanobacillus sp. FSL K6-0251]|uniref:hypothetical protein n=1 Tax=Oceanobacillus sp. FSL K6-0251 TaxID=2921602 RepID=UPI0030F8BAE3
MVSDIALMKHHVNVLFKKDDNNRMTFVNEPPNEAAPRIFIGGTQLGNVVRYSNALEENVIKKLERSTSCRFCYRLGRNNHHFKHRPANQQFLDWTCFRVS